MAYVPVAFILAGMAAYTVLAGADFGAGLWTLLAFGPGLAVVALTADAMPSNMHNMELAGFHHVLTKPLKIPNLMEILRATLKAA